MTKFKSMLMILIVVLPTLVWPTALHAEPVGPDDYRLFVSIAHRSVWHYC